MAATLAVEHRRRLAARHRRMLPPDCPLAIGAILFITIVAVVFGMAIALFLLTLI